MNWIEVAQCFFRNRGFWYFQYRSSRILLYKGVVDTRCHSEVMRWFTCTAPGYGISVTFCSYSHFRTTLRIDADRWDCVFIWRVDSCCIHALWAG